MMNYLTHLRGGDTLHNTIKNSELSDLTSVEVSHFYL